MFNASKLVQYVLSALLILSLLQPGAAVAQGGNGLLREVNAQTGKVHFIRTERGLPLPAAQALEAIPDQAADPAQAIARHFGREFGLSDPDRELLPVRAQQAQDGRLTVHYQQVYQDVPVMAGELVVNTDTQGNFYSMNGEVAVGLSLSTQPAIPPAEAQQIALQAAAKWYKQTGADFIASEPLLWVYEAGLLNPSASPAELVWRMEVTPANAVLPIRELVLVNAQRGNISLHFNQIDAGARMVGVEDKAAREKGIGDQAAPVGALVSPAGGFRKTYTANHNETTPGTLLCDQTRTSCTNGANPDADKAHGYAAETWNYYYNQHGRDSMNNQGMTIVSTVQYSVSFQNAFWDGGQMVYGDGMVSDDIVGHELSHGVTQYESNLFYYYQSGAINESFSDIWGELIDQSNTTGNDSAGVKWQIGEDSPVGAFRSMSNPPLFSDPDSIISPNYDTDPLFLDNGGVHHNSGVNNKAAYLMVTGGSFGGKTVTALGVSKTLAVYYEAQTNLLTSGSDYADLYSALNQACQHLVGGPKGITSADCQEVRDASDAVQMRAQPAGLPNFNTDAPLCDNGQTANTVFFDDIESGTSNWTFGASVGSNRWQVDSPDGPFAHSGLHALYANDRPATVAYSSATLRAITLPAGAYLHFSQAFGFEDYYALGTFDGGVLGYSTDGGSTWLDARTLFVNNGYNGVIDPNYDNPLRGRPAFVGDSHGYISSRVNLSTLAGRSVKFSWRMGLDTGGNDFGWWVDDVRIYTCGTTTGTATPTVTPTRTPTGGAPVTLTLTSVDTLDGWIPETSETSGLGGTVNGSGAALRVGDSASDQQYRSILSFATAQLPDNAVIQSVQLRLKLRGVTGTNPYGTHGSLTVDLRKGGFSGDKTLQSADFQASATGPGVMTIPNTPVNGWYSASLGGSNFSSVNLTGVTQFRLRFAIDDNDDLGEDYIAFNSGNATGDRPQLIITYSLP